MSTRAADGVRDYFLARTCDLTPVGVRRDSSVLYAPFSDIHEMSVLCTAVLSDTERQRMERLATDKQRAEFAQRRAFRRFCAATALDGRRNLSKIVFEETEKGRPFLAEAPTSWFSFSSCRFGMLGAWSVTCAVGVDIEDDTRNAEVRALAREFFTRDEAARVEQAASADRPAVFYQLWSLKEAALKSIGEGLPFGLDTFAFELLSSPRVTLAPAEFGGPGRFRAYRLGQGNLNGALVTRMPAGTIC